ncbi:hypothetical protein [Komagataeibacter xylinus]|nr:hypothetical protein [Komagataeibacter xylinus]
MRAPVQQAWLRLVLQARAAALQPLPPSVLLLPAVMQRGQP